MNTHVQVAWNGCQDELALFTCSGGESYCDEIDDWIRRESFTWFAAAEDEPRLLLLIDEASNSIAGVAAHDLYRPGARFLWCFALAAKFQGQRQASAFFRAVVSDMSARAPYGYATWLTDPANNKAIGFFEHMGAEFTAPPEDKPLLRFRFDLD